MRFVDVTKKAMIVGTVVAFNTVFSQSFYIKPTLGTTIPVINTQFPQVADGVEPLISEMNMTTGDSSFVNAEGNLAKGIRFGIAAGKMFNENFGVELGFDYLKGSQQTLAHSKVITPIGNSEIELLSNIWSIAATPSFVFQANGEKFIPYGRIGLYVPLGGKMYVDATVTDHAGVITGSSMATLDQTSKLEISSKFTLGYLGAAGVKYKLNDKIMVFGEFQFIDFNSIGKDAKLTEYSSTVTTPLGPTTTTLDELSTSEKERIYVDQLTQNSNVVGYSGFDPDKPEEKLGTYLNLSSLSFNFGAFITL